VDFGRKFPHRAAFSSTDPASADTNICSILAAKMTLRTLTIAGIHSVAATEAAGLTTRP
jgi:hypothetical protein